MAANLNSEQRKAVETLSGPMLVLAGAGSGKTRVVTYRIANLIRHGTQPDRILAVTFTNKAAAEMQERIGELIPGRKKITPVICTFHAHCVQILRRQIRHLGYPQNFAIYDRGDQEELARTVLREIKVSGKRMRPSELLYYIGNWKTHACRPAQATAKAETDKEHLAAMAYRRYQNALKLAGALDFDDLLLCTEDLFEAVPSVRQEEAQRFDHLLIDEYQDTNASQYRIVCALAREHRNLCVVGDDDQSIYGWRGAQVEYILRFADEWPGATVVRLEQNYRSTAEILEVANRLIAFNSHRHDKVLQAARQGGERPQVQQYKSETIEAETTIRDIQKRLKVPGRTPGDFAILFRTNEQPRAFETELRRAKLPYVLIGGMSFYDRKEVRDVLAYLRLLVSPTDEVALRRIHNRPARGISGPAFQTVLETAVSSGKPVWDLIQRGPPPGLSSRAQQGVSELVALIEKYQRRSRDEDLVTVATELIREIDYESEIARNYEQELERKSRMDAVEEVVNGIGAYQRKAKQPSLQGFLDEIALTERNSNDDKDKQLKRDAIVLLTMHSAKGLEFPEVYIVGMENGILPHHRSLDAGGDAIAEERRLCYVGLTRAQERLTLSMALTRMKWGKPRETEPSPFLFELTGLADNPLANKNKPKSAAAKSAGPKSAIGRKKRVRHQ